MMIYNQVLLRKGGSAHVLEQGFLPDGVTQGKEAEGGIPVPCVIASARLCLFQFNWFFISPVAH